MQMGATGVEDAVIAVGEQFSCPLGGAFGALAETVAVAHRRAQLARFLSTNSSVLRNACPELFAFLTDRAAELTYAEAWDPMIGEIDEAGRSGVSVVDLAVAWGLQLASASGTPAVWSAHVAAVRPLRFAGRRLACGDAVELASDGRCATLVVSQGARRTAVIDVERDGMRWRPQGASHSPDTLSPDIVGGRDIPASYLDGIPGAPVAAVDEAMRASLRDGVACLGASSPTYAAWVSHVVRQVIALPVSKGRTKSGSRSDLPGLLHLSLPESAVTLAENLVHEASHQYFHLALRVARVTGGEDTRLYFSPAVGRERPLDRLMIAFHAFANVTAWYADLSVDGSPHRDEAQRQIDILAPKLGQLREPLIGNTDIMPMGRALLQPIDSLLAQSRILRPVVL